MKLKSLNKKFVAIIVSFLSLILCITSFGGLKTKNAKAAYNPDDFHTIGMTEAEVLANESLLERFIQLSIGDFGGTLDYSLDTIILDSHFYNTAFLSKLFSVLFGTTDIQTGLDELVENDIHLLINVPSAGGFYDISDESGYTVFYTDTTIISNSQTLGDICVLSLWPMPEMYGALLNIQNNYSNGFCVYVIPLVEISLGTNGLHLIMNDGEYSFYDTALDTWRRYL